MKLFEYVLATAVAVAVPTAVAICLLKLYEHEYKITGPTNVIIDSDDIIVPLAINRRKTITLKNTDHTLEIYDNHEYVFINISNGGTKRNDIVPTSGKVINCKLNEQQQIAVNYLINNFNEIVANKNKLKFNNSPDICMYISLHDTTINLGNYDVGIFSLEIDTHLNVLMTLLENLS